MTFRYHRTYRGRVQAVIFDWAGTTVDFGSCAPTEVFRAAFSSEGVEVTDAEIREPMGMRKWDHIRHMTRQPSVAQKWEATFGRPATDEDVDRMYASFLPLQVEVVRDHAAPIAGVTAAVNRLRQLGVKIGSSTGYPRQVSEALVPLAAERGYAPDCVVDASDVEQGRPAPWMIYENMRRLDVYPAEAVVKVDDTTSGIVAGLNAGTWTVGVTASGNLVGLDADQFARLPRAERVSRVAEAEEKLWRAGAHFVINDVTAMPGVVETINRLLAEGRTPQSS